MTISWDNGPCQATGSESTALRSPAPPCGCNPRANRKAAPNLAQHRGACDGAADAGRLRLADCEMKLGASKAWAWRAHEYRSGTHHRLCFSGPPRTYLWYLRLPLPTARHGRWRVFSRQRLDDSAAGHQRLPPTARSHLGLFEFLRSSSSCGGSEKGRANWVLAPPAIMVAFLDALATNPHTVATPGWPLGFVTALARRRRRSRQFRAESGKPAIAGQ